MSRHATSVARAGALAAAGVLAITATATAQTRPQTAPPGVVCVGPNPQYGYGVPPGVPSYGIGTGQTTGGGNPGAVRLTRTQMLINQRIAQAAIRRTQAIQAWLDAGVVSDDICGGALGPEDFGGITTALDAPQVTPPAPRPRPLNIRATGGGNPGGVTLSRSQFLINQRISQAAVRRANALRTRLLTGLTGGDVVDGTLGKGTLRIGVRITAATPVSPPPARTTTRIVGQPSGNPARVTVSRRQALINQRISQAAVRRANAIIAHLRTGLNGSDFQNGSITAADLAPGVVTP